MHFLLAFLTQYVNIPCVRQGHCNFFSLIEMGVCPLYQEGFLRLNSNQLMLDIGGFSPRTKHDYFRWLHDCGCQTRNCHLATVLLMLSWLHGDTWTLLQGGKLGTRCCVMMKKSYEAKVLTSRPYRRWWGSWLLLFNFAAQLKQLVQWNLKGFRIFASDQLMRNL